jgi:hypothetical protein
MDTTGRGVASVVWVASRIPALLALCAAANSPANSLNVRITAQGTRFPATFEISATLVASRARKWVGENLRGINVGLAIRKDARIVGIVFFVLMPDSFRDQTAVGYFFGRYSSPSSELSGS